MARRAVVDADFLFGGHNFLPLLFANRSFKTFNRYAPFKPFNPLPSSSPASRGKKEVEA
jgi:hypothetical protein